MTINRAMLWASCMAGLVFLYASDYTWFAICAQAGFIFGLHAGRSITEKKLRA